MKVTRGARTGRQVLGLTCMLSRSLWLVATQEETEEDSGDLGSTDNDQCHKERLLTGAGVAQVLQG